MDNGPSSRWIASNEGTQPTAGSFFFASSATCRTMSSSSGSRGGRHLLALFPVHASTSFADSSAHLTIASKRSRSSLSSSGRCRVMAGNIYRERRRAEGLARLRKLRMRRRSKNMTISLPVLSRSLRLWQSWFRPCCLEFAIRSVFRIAAGFLRPAVEPIPGDHVAFFTHLVHEVVTAVKLRRIS